MDSLPQACAVGLLSTAPPGLADALSSFSLGIDVGAQHAAPW
ncbi:MAG TPA: hypothetical protein VJ183_04565 [Chloroflexia bacterium]|nr:hypothetical protein [Chloroflexia bacterium]